MIEIREYLQTDGHSPYARWFHGLNAQAAAKVTTALVSLEHGNLSNTKSLAAALLSPKSTSVQAIEFTLVKDGKRLIILLGRGTKKGQSKDIQKAKALWQEYKRREKEE